MTQPDGPPREERSSALPMFQGERRAQIMRRLIDHGRVDVGDLAEEFGVTGETIRRDLNELQRERLVRHYERREMSLPHRAWRYVWDNLQYLIVGHGHQPFWSIGWLFLLIFLATCRRFGFLITIF